MGEPDSLLIYWRAYGDWGFKLVIFGVVVEVIAAIVDFVAEIQFKKWHEKWKRRLRLIEFLGGGILIFGLSKEYKGHKRETAILDSDNSKLRAQAAQSAEELERLKIRFLTTEAQLKQSEEVRASLFVVASNAVFTSRQASSVVSNANVAVLENLSRHLSADQKRVLFEAVQPLPRLRFMCEVSMTASDAEGLAGDIIQVFTAAKWQFDLDHSSHNVSPFKGIEVVGRTTEGIATRTIADVLTVFGLTAIAVTNNVAFTYYSVTNAIVVRIGKKP